MEIEWWMIDGGICLIVLFSAILGAAKGLGDTLLRLLGIGGGIALGFFYGDRVTAYLKASPFNDKVHAKVFELLRGTVEADGAGSTSTSLVDTGTQNATDTYQTALPKLISWAANDLADKAADEAANRFTSMIMGVLGFTLIVLAVWLLVTLLRAILRSFRSKSFVLGFADRFAGFVLGIVKGAVIACIAVMLLIPVTTIVSPETVPAMLKALDETQIACIIYDANPLLLLVKKLFVL